MIVDKRKEILKLMKSISPSKKQIKLPKNHMMVNLRE
jgi:hypothetical protein